jgi:hypothetical protein
MPVLGQIANVRPLVGESWTQAKQVWMRKVGYEAHAQEVVDFHNSDAPVRIACAPARTSKSWSAAHDVIAYCMPTDPPCDVLGWVIGPNFNTNKEFQYLWDLFVVGRDLVPEACIKRAMNNPRNGDMEINIEIPFGKKKHRVMIHGLSAQNEKVLQGEEVTFAILSEAAEHPEHILSKYIGTRTWKILLPTTPKQQAAWLRELAEQGEADGSLGIDSFTFPFKSNPTYNKERYERERRKAEIRAKKEIGPNATATDDPYFAEQFEGRWVYYTGRALPFSRNRHVISPDKVDFVGCRIGVSVDYGYEDPSSAGFWCVMPNGILVRFDEIYERHLSTQKFVGRITEKLEKLGMEADLVSGDPSRPEVSKMMLEAGLPVVVIDKNAQRDRAAGHRRLVDLLSEGPKEGFPGLYVTSNCKHTISEFEHLRYKEGFRDEYGTTALVGADHAFDDARYFVMTRPAPHAEPETKDWLREFKRRRRQQHVASFDSSYHAVIGGTMDAY